jgi:predicted ATPase with chaperone activity
MSIANFAPRWPRCSHACMVAGLTGNLTGLVTTRPLRVLHQTISEVGLIGGGHIPLPGEVALAHHGMRFLGERLASDAMSSQSCRNR